jgi:cation diffusion facilitator CzcD-associated flavoprotein CzcO
VDAGRDGQPFTVHVAGPGGDEERLEARAVIDASGTWRRPNPAGADGLPSLGECVAVGRVRYQIPDFAVSEPFAGRHTVVLGAGHSAATAVIELARIAEANPGTTVTRVLRRGVAGDRATGRLLGSVQLFGHKHAEIAKRIDIAATAIYHGMTVDEVSDLDLSCTPPLGSPWDAVQIGAQAWTRHLARETR